MPHSHMALILMCLERVCRKMLVSLCVGQGSQFTCAALLTLCKSDWSLYADVSVFTLPGIRVVSNSVSKH